MSRAAIVMPEAAGLAAGAAGLFTPREEFADGPSSEPVRHRFLLSALGLSQYREAGERGRKWEANLELADGRTIRARGASCGLGCYCDAVLVSGPSGPRTPVMGQTKVPARRRVNGPQYQAAIAQCEALRTRVAALEEGLRPFAHDDLCKIVGGNNMGDTSPVFGRDKAILRLGDFKLARALLSGGGA